MPAGWKNPIRRVKAPKLPTDPIEPIQIEEIQQLLKTCQSNYSGTRDKAMILGLLDTGARAREFLNINLEDVDLATGAVMIRQGKGRKPRMVFMGRKTIRAIRGYLRHRHDNNLALWVSIHGERMTYAALRCLLRRRAEKIGFKSIPTPHDFRRAFALVMLRNGVDIFALQKLMGHSDLRLTTNYPQRQLEMPTDKESETARLFWRRRADDRYRTRPDPFEKDWTEIEAKLATAPELEAKAIFEWLCERDGTQYQEGQQRLQRPQRVERQACHCSRLRMAH